MGVIDDAVQTVRSESAVIGRLNGFAREVILKGVSVIKKAPTPYGVRRESGAIPMRDRTLSLD